MIVWELLDYTRTVRSDAGPSRGLFMTRERAEHERDFLAEIGKLDPVFTAIVRRRVRE